MQSVKQKTSFDAFHPFSQYLHAIAFAIGMTDACGRPSTYLVDVVLISGKGMRQFKSCPTTNKFK